MSDTKDKQVFYSRKFINPRSKCGMAAIEANVSIQESDDSISVASHLTIADCNRRISLEFDVYDYGLNLRQNTTYLRERRSKARLLQKTIEGYFAALEVAYAEMEEKLPAKMIEAERQAQVRKAEKESKQWVNII